MFTLYEIESKKLSYTLNCIKQDVYPFLLHIGKLISLHPALSLFGTQQQLTHPPVKSSTLPLRMIPIFQGVAPRHTIFTSSCVIPFCDSGTGHSHSGKELILSSLEESYFSGLIVLLMFSHYPYSNDNMTF